MWSSLRSAQEPSLNKQESAFATKATRLFQYFFSLALVSYTETKDGS
jgi:hypothetical protein